MAKSIGLVGTLSGKSGNFVFCKGADGRTIVRPYQPQVYNPKTAGQSMQRAKMVLAGLLSSITPSAVLVSMGAGRKVANRSAFVRNILRKCEVDEVGGDYRAVIVPEDIVFARGEAPVRFSVATPSLTATKVTVSVTPAISTDLVNKTGVRLVAVVMEKYQNHVNFIEVKYQDVIFTTASTAQTVEINLSALTANESHVGVYAIPFDISSDAISQFGGENGLDNTSATVLAAALTSNASLVKAWGDSHIVGNFIPFTGA